MNRLILFLAALFLVALASPALAADGGDASADYLTLLPGTPAATYEQIFYLCHGKDSGDGSCTEFDTRAAIVGMRSAPHQMVVEVVLATSCSSTHDVAVKTSATSGGVVHEIGAGLDLNSTTTRAVVDLRSSSVDRFITIALTNMTDCAALGFDVIAKFYWF